MALIVSIISVLIFAYRAYRRQVTKLEWAMFAILALHTLITQEIFVMDRARWRFEERYLIPALPLLWAYVILSLRELKLIKYLKIALIVCGIYCLSMSVKSIIPGSSRANRLQASEWATEVIRGDWRGPKADDERRFALNHFSIPNRPIISGFPRVAVALKARYASSLMKDYDTPDYVVCNDSKSNFHNWASSNYFILAEKRIGKRNYLVYKRNDNGNKADKIERIDFR